LFLKEEELQEPTNKLLMDIIQGSVEYALRYGTRTRKKSDFHSSGRGSDAITSCTNLEVYSVKQGKFDVLVEEENYGYSYGTWASGWSERDIRRLKILWDDKLIFSANRTINDEAGNILEPIKTTLVRPWCIDKVESLDKILDDIEEFPKEDVERCEFIQKIVDGAYLYFILNFYKTP